MAASNTDDRDDDQSPDGSGELPDHDVEARWADIVATLGDISQPGDDDGERPAPSGTEPGSTSASAPGDVAATDDASAPPARIVRPAGPRDWPASDEVEALEEVESHFTPPEPPPLLSKDPLLTMAWGFVVGIPVLSLATVLVVSAFPSVHIPPLAGQIGIGLFVAGLGVLFWRMPHHRDGDDGPGAVV
ncbi:hypothetical protein [Antribacter gilvus]|uniref:hypothetical protein n=1 Tax=Antribacter gilvus TaxID=2304675 RepID=UPI000F796A05|nr:hypothetical protein [Antribacter gilvus]